MAAGLFFTYGVFVVFTTLNAFRRPTSPHPRVPTIWILAMLNNELPGVTFVTRLAATTVAWALGAFTSPVGRIGLWLVALSSLGLPVLALRSRRTSRELSRHATATTPRPNGLAGRAGWPRRLPTGLEVTGPFQVDAEVAIEFYRRAGERQSEAPTLLYLHGGSWTGGDPHTQARPLIHHLASRGWLVATTTYPLSPAATFPDHLIGVKQAIGWLREHGVDHGVDPDRIAIAGGSAGAHLAALSALTPNRAEYQRGFEDTDTSVMACVSLYGIYDFLNRNRTRPDWPLIPRLVMKAEPAADPDRYRAASPIDQVTPDAVPFLVIHGAHDSLVPPGEARAFVEALRDAGGDVRYVEVEGAQHAFDAVESRRSRTVAALATGFLESVSGDRRLPATG